MTMPGTIEVDHSGSEPRVRFTLPQEWFSLSELRSFAAFLTLVADENGPPEAEPAPTPAPLHVVFNGGREEEFLAWLRKQIRRSGGDPGVLSR